MKKLKHSPIAWAALVVLILQLFYYLGPGGNSNPQFPGVRTLPPETKRDKARKARTTIAPNTWDTESSVNTHLPNELRDYSKYRKRMLDRGRTEEQISRDYARAVKKYLESKPKSKYLDLLDSGIDPEYDLKELDAGLDEGVPEY
jgi:hypothetical protein